MAGVLSGNRNFEGRIHALVKANYLASPPLVVAYALAGTVDIDLQNDPIGQDSDGNDVFLKDVWPTQQEILDAINEAVKPEQFAEMYDGIEDSNPRGTTCRSPAARSTTGATTRPTSRSRRSSST